MIASPAENFHSETAHFEFLSCSIQPGFMAFSTALNPSVITFRHHSSLSALEIIVSVPNYETILLSLTQEQSPSSEQQSSERAEYQILLLAQFTAHSNCCKKLQQLPDVQ